jgi:hypothetical protein
VIIIDFHFGTGYRDQVYFQDDTHGPNLGEKHRSERMRSELTYLIGWYRNYTARPTEFSEGSPREVPTASDTKASLNVGSGYTPAGVRFLRSEYSPSTLKYPLPGYIHCYPLL